MLKKFLSFALVAALLMPAFADDLAGNAVCSESMCQVTRSSKVARVKHPAPAWEAASVVNGEIVQLGLKDFKGKFLVMVFYPKDFTFVCPTELLAFSDRSGDFKELGAEVVGISVDNEFSHLAWTNMPRNKGGLEGIKIPLVSDLTKEISRKYDVLVEEEGVALRGLFIIDPEGVVRVKHINDFPLGRSVDEALRLVDAIKYTDERGEVCPANWVKGGKTIKPDPKNAKEYFESVNKIEL